MMLSVYKLHHSFSAKGELLVQFRNGHSLHLVKNKIATYYSNSPSPTHAHTQMFAFIRFILGFASNWSFFICDLQLDGSSLPFALNLHFSAHLLNFHLKLSHFVTGETERNWEWERQLERVTETDNWIRKEKSLHDTQLEIESLHRTVFPQCAEWKKIA